MEPDYLKLIGSQAPGVVIVALWLSSRLSRVEAEIGTLRAFLGAPPPQHRPRRMRGVVPILAVSGVIGCLLLAWKIVHGA